MRNANHHAANVFRRAEELTGLKDVFFLAARKLSRRYLPVGSTYGSGYLQRRKAIARQLRFIQSDAEFTALAAEDCNGGNVRDLLHCVMQLRCDATQLKVVVATAGQRQGEHGHVVNGPGFHQRLRRTGRNQVVVCAELLIQADDTAFLVLPHHKANNGERHAGTGSGVDILHTGNLRQQLFHGLRDALFHFTRGSPWQLNHDVHHRDNDLRLFFAG